MTNFIDGASAKCVTSMDCHSNGLKHGNRRQKPRSGAAVPFVVSSIHRRVAELSSCCKIFCSATLLTLQISATNAQQEINYALHANIIYRFTKYIDWPSSTASGDFIIGIVGDTPLYSVLQDFVANKTVGNRRISIIKMSSSADVYNCHILFVSVDKSRSLKKIAKTTKGSPILIISETGSDGLKESCINFDIINEHLKLEINKSNIEERKLNIASELLSLGTIVK